MSPSVELVGVDWVNRLDTESGALIKNLFPFKFPSLEVAQNCFLILDPALQLEKAFHQTTTAILLEPRRDDRLLLPAIALEDETPMNLWVIGASTLEATTVGHRTWAVWGGRNLLSSIPLNILTFSPERSKVFLEQAQEIREIYGQLLNGNRAEALTTRLNQLMYDFGVVGGWFRRYYTEVLPQRIAVDLDQARVAVANVFHGLETKVARSLAKYHSLTPEDRELLSEPVQMTVEFKTRAPFAYFSGLALKVEDGQWFATEDRGEARNPTEIVAQTQGVVLDNVVRIYLSPSASSRIRVLVQERLKQLGLDEALVYAEPTGVRSYTSCDLRYGQFNLDSLKRCLVEGSIQPLLPAELLSV